MEVRVGDGRDKRLRKNRRGKEKSRERHVKREKENI